ncbi:MAG TPA: hypothetical protein VMC80_03545, partial [Patescibacteria group bacterium]|nr:hypothetical protein [Patescibacteria group bacterium]
MTDKVPEGRIYSILGIVSAVLSLIVLPILFGPAAVILGVIAINKKDKTLGIISIVLGIVLAILSWLIA